MSELELPLGPGSARAVRFGQLALGIIELAAFRGRSDEVRAHALRAGWSLPGIGHAQIQSDRLSLCIRPDRWLLLSTREQPESDASAWHVRLGASAAVIDHSSGLTGFHLTGPSTQEVLARGCRLDLDPSVFPTRSAAATLIAQVPVILGALSSGLVLLTASTTARHFSEWLAHTAAPFGLRFVADGSMSILPGDLSE